MKILAPQVRFDDVQGDDYKTTTHLIKLSKRERDELAKMKPRNFIKDLTEMGVLQPYGCDCTHCRNDWDCCGRFTLSYNQVKPAGKRHLKVQQVFTRNL
jgi:hypothetical protein